MINPALQAAINKGFDCEKNAKFTSKEYMLSLALQAISNEHEDYLKSFGLSNNFRNELHSINKQHDNFHAKIVKLIDDEGAKNCFKDFEELMKILHKFFGDTE